MKPVDDLILTEPEAAQQLKVSGSVLRKWRRQGSGPQFIRIQRMIRYALSDLHRWLEARKEATTQEKEII